jgi:hypothetical protein
MWAVASCYRPNQPIEFKLKLMAKNVHVTYRKDADKWAVISEGSQRAASLHDNKSSALGAGRDIARNNASELVIHGMDGKIQDKDSYGRDPFPPRDTKN